ncbi:MAG: IS110 family transposase [Pseudonocardiales bacterium]|nr:MAG: IS110 family transposase [Pseudonocardiales bacterium]
MAGSGLLKQSLPGSALVVAIDPGKVSHRVWFSTGDVGLVEEPRSVPSLRPGLDEVTATIRRLAGTQAPVVAIEATGALHGSWVRALEERFALSVRVFAPSETAAARAQLGSRRFKSDDRDCAALTYLARQGQGRPVVADPVEAVRGAVRYRRGLVAERKIAQQRLHDQLNVLCPGLSAPAGHARVLELEDSSGQAVLACAAAFAGRAPTVRSLQARAPGRLFDSNARYWVQRWKTCLPPPADAQVRAERLGRSLCRWQAIRADTAAVEVTIEALLAATAGQVLTTLPGVAVIRAASFAAFSLPVERFPTAEHLYSATGLAPARYQSATINRNGRISRTGLAEHRDALMGIAWGLSRYCDPFIDRDRELRARGMAPIQARVALARHACRLTYRMLKTQQPFDEQRYRQGRHPSER